MNSRKIFISYICILCLLLLTSCGKDFSDTDQQFHDYSSKNKLSGTTLTIMATEDWITSAEKDLGTNFEAATGIQIIYKTYPADEYLDILFDALDSDKAPDIFMTQSGFAIKNTYHLNEYAIGLAGEPWDLVYDSFSKVETSINGINYGMTYSDTTTDYYLVYNKAIMEKAGIKSVPTTFDEFLNMCDRITDTGSIPIYEPMADGWHQTMLFAETGQVFNKLEPGIFEELNNNKTTFSDNKNMLRSLEQISCLADKGYFGDSFETDKYDDAIEYLATGEYAMCMLRPGAINAITSSELNNGYTHDDFGIMLLPICDNQVLNIHPTGPARYISRKSSNIEGAKLYFNYITKKENIQYVIDNDNSVENLPFLMGQTPKYDKLTTDFVNSFDYSHSGMVVQDEVTYFNEQWGEISNNILEMCKGNMTANQVLYEIDLKRAELAHNAQDPAWK